MAASTLCGVGCDQQSVLHWQAQAGAPLGKPWPRRTFGSDKAAAAVFFHPMPGPCRRGFAPGWPNRKVIPRVHHCGCRLANLAGPGIHVRPPRKRKRHRQCGAISRAGATRRGAFLRRCDGANASENPLRVVAVPVEAVSLTELAEAVRFELTDGCPSLVFKTSAIDHSATLPASPPATDRRCRCGAPNDSTARAVASATGNRCAPTVPTTGSPVLTHECASPVFSKPVGRWGKKGFAQGG